MISQVQRIIDSPMNQIRIHDTLLFFYFLLQITKTLKIIFY